MIKNHKGHKNWVLLLPHCLKDAVLCKAKNIEGLGLQCVGCKENCPINILKAEAQRLDYGGVCISSGGSLSLKYIKEKKPEVVVAIACEKELQQGKDAVEKMAKEKSDFQMPKIIVIKLSKDECVNTEVDVGEVIDNMS